MKKENVKKSVSKKKLKKLLTSKKTILSLISLICFVTLIISLFNIFGWFKDNKQIDEEAKETVEKADIQEVSDNENTIKIENEIKEDDLYWKYIDTKLINVNFNELKKENKDTVGWIQVMGTNINYPIVQTTNNDYYLTHSFKKKANLGGWIFLDYRNNIKELDKNTIIYGHGRLDTSMFGSLKNIFTNNWLKNTDNFIVKISTESHNTLWQVFSVYKIPTTNDYIQVDFKNNIDFENFYTMLLNRSEHNFNTNVTTKDKILTLSTCYNDNDKVVLHAKLIKQEKK
jgi:sortase B